MIAPPFTFEVSHAKGANGEDGWNFPRPEPRRFSPTPRIRCGATASEFIVGRVRFGRSYRQVESGARLPGLWKALWAFNGQPESPFASNIEWQ